MAVAGSFHLSHDLGIRKSHGYSKKFKGFSGRGNLHLLGATLSSHASRRDCWGICLSDRAHRPVHSTPYRYNIFKCRSFLVPGKPFDISGVKPSVMALTRSYNALQGNPLVVKLVPPIGIIIFAVWGLGPLLREGRNFFLNKSDNSWKKSGTYHVMTSYVQPLLLWAGAILICRAFDRVVPPSEAGLVVKQRLLNFIKSLSTVLAFAYCLSSVIQQAQKFMLETNDSSDTRNMGFQLAGKVVYSAVWVAAVSLFMELLGFSTQKWLTAGGLGTVLLTLAGREIFTNFLSSAMIHATRPFVVNEWIQTKIEGYEVSGTVEHVGWWSPTIIRGEDREAVHIPNHKFTMNVVRNLSQKTHWRIKTHLAISHLDVSKINNIVADMRKVLAKNHQVEQQRLHRRVFLDNINAENQALLILISCFVKTSHFEEYLCVKEAILMDLLRVISHHRARLATPIRTVQKIYNDVDLENVPFADTFFTHGAAAAANRPLLLIEPPYKINGEEKTKTRPMRTNGEHDSKAATRPTTDAKTDANADSTAVADSKLKGPLSSTNNEDIKPGAVSNSGKDSKVPATSVSDPKVGEKAKVASKHISRADAKDVNDSTMLNSDSDSLGQSTYDSKRSKKPGTGTAKHNIKVDTPTPIADCSEKPGMPSNTAHSKQEVGKSPVAQPPGPRSALEENIVLGVALDGSKRTLPIEEVMDPPKPSELKELATSRNGNGPQAVENDRADGQTSSSRTIKGD